MRCVRLSWSINHDFTLKWSAGQKESNERRREKDRGDRDREEGLK